MQEQVKSILLLGNIIFISFENIKIIFPSSRKQPLLGRCPCQMRIITLYCIDTTSCRFSLFFFLCEPQFAISFEIICPNLMFIEFLS